MRMQTKRVRVAHVTTTINHTHMRTHKLVLLLVASFRSHFTQSTFSRPTPRLKSTRIRCSFRGKRRETDDPIAQLCRYDCLFVCLFVCWMRAIEPTSLSNASTRLGRRIHPFFSSFASTHPAAVELALRASRSLDYLTLHERKHDDDDDDDHDDYRAKRCRRRLLFFQQAIGEA